MASATQAGVGDLDAPVAGMGTNDAAAGAAMPTDPVSTTSAATR